jgi:GNAT superfamily N-acetyltransferase
LERDCPSVHGEGPAAKGIGVGTKEPRHKEQEVLIRAATPEDEAAALSLIEELFEPPGVRAPGYTEERGRAGFKYAVHDRDADVLLAMEGDRIVGMASVYADILSIRYGPRCWLQDLVVTASHRSRGVGARLIEAATEWASERGCTHLELSSGAGRADAHRFYLAQGMSQSYNFTKKIE